MGSRGQGLEPLRGRSFTPVIAQDLETLQLTDTRFGSTFSDGNERMLRYFAKPLPNNG